MDKGILLKPRLPEDDVLLDGVGPVRVRGLSRDEVLELKRSDLSQDDMELRVVSWCMVDPQLTEEDVKAWRQASLSDELEQITAAIHELSGLVPGAAKRAYKSNGGRSRSSVRVRAGGAAGDDGGSAAGGDAG